MAQEQFLDPPMPDVIGQWRHYLSLLGCAHTSRVLDVGCNTGDAEHLLLRLHPEVPLVVGVDHSTVRIEGALKTWNARGAQERIAFLVGDGRALPFPDESFDRVMCVETLEWICPPVQALVELRRVLRPGGRALVVHTDFDTQVFAGTDLSLTREIVHRFADAGPDGTIGRKLVGLARHAGFCQVEASVYPLVNTSFEPNTYSYRAVTMMSDWLLEKRLFSAEQLTEWRQSLVDAAEAGAFFYSVNRNICVCER